MAELRNSIHLKTKIISYYAFLRAVAQYDIDVWRSAYQLDYVLKIQKRVIPIKFSNYTASYKPLFKKLQNISAIINIHFHIPNVCSY